MFSSLSRDKMYAKISGRPPAQNLKSESVNLLLQNDGFNKQEASDLPGQTP
jgi:hypothetical protein